MMKRNRGRFTTILAVSGEKLPGSVVFPPTDAPLSPRCICRRQRSSITPGTLRVPWAVFLHIQKTASTAKAILAVLWEDYKKDFLAFLGWYLYPYKKSWTFKVKGGGEPLSFGQRLHRFETAFEYYGDLFF